MVLCEWMPTPRMLVVSESSNPEKHAKYRAILGGAYKDMDIVLADFVGRLQDAGLRVLVAFDHKMRASKDSKAKYGTRTERRMQGKVGAPRVPELADVGITATTGLLPRHVAATLCASA